jgi:peptidoglycan-N-acetylglucosamine deacetylase
VRERRLGGPRAKLSDLWWALPRLSRAGNGRAVGVLSVWIGWNRLLEWLWRPRAVRPGGVLRYRRAHHWGRRLTLKDGTVVARGDAVLELHFDNEGLWQMTEARDWNPWETIERIEEDLNELAELIAHGRPGPVRALHGVTLFASPGRRLGFELHPVPHTWAWSLQRFYLIALLPIYHRNGWREFDRMRRDRWPAELWMSVNQLQHRRQVSPPPLKQGRVGT